jgi:hypothetical protein
MNANARMTDAKLLFLASGRIFAAIFRPMFCTFAPSVQMNVISLDKFSMFVSRRKSKMKINPDNVFGSASTGDVTVMMGRKEENRRAFINRPTKGKTARKRRFPSKGIKTNVGDPMKGQSSGGKRK